MIRETEFDVRSSPAPQLVVAGFDRSRVVELVTEFYRARDVEAGTQFVIAPYLDDGLERACPGDKWSNTAVALDTPLNTRQLDVLRWVEEGCPDGRWIGSSYKATAAALQNRRLVTVSKKGRWKAAIEPAGVYYLKHGDYPADHFPNKRRSYTRIMRLVHSEEGKPQRPLTRPAPDEPTPTRKLLQDIINAGGILDLNTRDNNTNYASLVAIINRRQMAPDGQQVILMDGADYHHKVLRLLSVAEWKTQPPAEVVAAERIGRWHPAVSALRSENRLSSIERPQRQRALRILHALAREAEARGYTVQEPPKREPRGYGYHDREKLSRCLMIGVAPIRCSVGIAQLKDKVLHEATIKELERAKRESWYRIPTHDHVPSKRLSVTLSTDSRYSSEVLSSDTKTIPLESRLPDVMTLFERWVLIHTKRTKAERRAEIEKRKRQEREDERAREAYVQHALGERLVVDLEAWELAARLRAYLTAEPVVFGGFVFRGRPKTTELDIEYSKYALRASAMRRQIISRGQGGIRANIGQRDLKLVHALLPRSPEQRAIASAIDDASLLISTLERLITKKEAIKQGMMQQLFALPADDQLRASLGALASFLSGGTPDRSNAVYWKGSIPWISAATMKRIEVASSEQFVSDATPEWRTGISELCAVGADTVGAGGDAAQPPRAGQGDQAEEAD